MTKSKTINFAIVMAMLTQLNGAIQMVAPMLEPNTFAIVSMVIGILTAGGAVKLRYMTSESMSDK